MNGRKKLPGDITTVANLSAENLSKEENTLLSKGLPFCLTLTQLDDNYFMIWNHSSGVFAYVSFSLISKLINKTMKQASPHPPRVWMPPKGRDAVLEAYVHVEGLKWETSLQLQRVKTSLPLNSRH